MAFSGTTTPEYKAVQRLTAELVIAVQSDLCEVSNHLLSRGMITESSHGEFTDLRLASAHVRASNLIRTILNKIKMDSRNFDTLVKVLGENELYYKSVLDKLESYRERENLTRSALSTDRESQNLAHSLDLEQSDNELESNPFLGFSTPYKQYGHKRVSSSNPQRGYNKFKRSGAYKLSMYTDCCLKKCDRYGPLIGSFIGIIIMSFGFTLILLSLYYNGCRAKMYMVVVLIVIIYLCFLFLYFIYLVLSHHGLIIKLIALLCLVVLFIGLLTYTSSHFCH